MIGEFSLPDEALEKLLQDNVTTVMVLGASDSGKTTLVQELARFCTSRKKTAVLDLDPGQSHIGPPTTVTWAKVGEGFDTWDRLEMRDFYFIGDTSPRGNLLSLTTGARLMWDKAHQAAERLIVDTTGYITGMTGRVLKLHLIDLLRPQIIFALFRGDELDHILTFFRGMKTPTVFEIPVPSLITGKDFSQRRTYRELGFKHYFDRARDIELCQEDIGLDTNLYPQHLMFRLVSLRDKYNHDRALGIIKDTDRVNRTVLIYSPVPNPEVVGRVVLGKLSITPKECRQLA